MTCYLLATQSEMVRCTGTAAAYAPQRAPGAAAAFDLRMHVVLRPRELLVWLWG